MTRIANPAPKPGSAILLIFVVLALCGAEIYWLYNWRRANDDLFVANVRRTGQNTLDERKIRELRAAAVRIDGLFLRLQDPFAPTPQSVQQPKALIAGLRPNSTDPMVIQDFVKAGLVAVPAGTVRAESSFGYQLSSNKLEFHRIVPLIAQEENSSVFLFIDHLEFVRPKSTGSFSVKPTALQTRLTARMFTSATR